MLMCLGSTSGVSLVTIIIRRHFFRKRFKRMVETDPKARARVEAVEAREAAKRKDILRRAHLDTSLLHSGKRTPASTPHLTPHLENGQDASRAPSRPSPQGSRSASAIDLGADEKRAAKEKQRERERQREREKEKARERKAERERIKKHGIRADMVRRVDAPVRINAMSVGGYLDAPGASSQLPTPAPSPQPPTSTATTPEPSATASRESLKISTPAEPEERPLSTPEGSAAQPEILVHSSTPLTEEPEDLALSPSRNSERTHRKRASDGGIKPDPRSLPVPRSVTMGKSHRSAHSTWTETSGRPSIHGAPCRRRRAHASPLRDSRVSRASAGL